MPDTPGKTPKTKTPKVPRPPKVDLPTTKPATDKAQIAALWATVKVLSDRLARVEDDEDSRAVLAAGLRKPAG